jgi:hypothetical protein
MTKKYLRVILLEVKMAQMFIYLQKEIPMNKYFFLLIFMVIFPFNIEDLLRNLFSIIYHFRIFKKE